MNEVDTSYDLQLARYFRQKCPLCGQPVPENACLCMNCGVAPQAELDAQEFIQDYEAYLEGVADGHFAVDANWAKWFSLCPELTRFLQYQLKNTLIGIELIALEQREQELARLAPKCRNVATINIIQQFLQKIKIQFKGVQKLFQTTVVVNPVFVWFQKYSKAFADWIIRQKTDDLKALAAIETQMTTARTNINRFVTTVKNLHLTDEMQAFIPASNAQSLRLSMEYGILIHYLSHLFEFGDQTSHVIKQEVQS